MPIRVKHRLSPRQLQVIRLLALGLAGKEVAARLGISVRTVEAYAAAARRKHRAPNLAGLIFILRRLL